MKMRFEVFNKKEKEEETVYFDLQKTTREIILRQVDKDGSEIAGNNIAGITSDGKLRRFERCSAKGINTDINGRIKLDD